MPTKSASNINSRKSSRPHTALPLKSGGGGSQIDKNSSRRSIIQQAVESRTALVRGPASQASGMPPSGARSIQSAKSGDISLKTASQKLFDRARQME